MAVDHLHHIVGLGHILGHIGILHLALGLALVQGFLHHARAHGGHLRPVVGVDDGGHDVAAKGGSYLIEQVLVVLACLHVVIVAYLELSAVGSEDDDTRGPRSRPITVAPIKAICGFSALNRFTRMSV